MNIETVHKNNLSVAVVTAGEPVITDPQSALDLAMSVKYETGSHILETFPSTPVNR